MNFNDWNEWWLANEDQVMRLTVAIVNRYNSWHEPQDLVNEVYLRGAFRTLDFDESKEPLEEEKVLSFVFSVIRNALVSRYRWEQTERRKREEWKRRNPPEKSDEEEPPFEQLERLHREFLRRLESCWQDVRLTAKERLAVWYWLESGMERFIALKMLDITLADGATQQRLYDAPLCRARRKLRRAFAPLAELVAELGSINILEDIGPFLKAKLIDEGIQIQFDEFEMRLCCC